MKKERQQYHGEADRIERKAPILEDGGKRAPSSKGAGAASTKGQNTVTPGGRCWIGIRVTARIGAKAALVRAEVSEAVAQARRLVGKALRNGRRR